MVAVAADNGFGDGVGLELVDEDAGFGGGEGGLGVEVAVENVEKELHGVCGAFIIHD